MNSTKQVLMFSSSLSNTCSRFALIAGETPAVPVNHLTPDVDVRDRSIISPGFSSERAINSQTADAAIWKNVEAQMRNLTNVKDFIFKKVSRVRLQFCPR